MPIDYARVLPEAARKKRITHLELSYERIQKRLETEVDPRKRENMGIRLEEYQISLDRLRDGLSERPIYVPIGVRIGV